MDKSIFAIQAEYLETLAELEMYLISNDTDEVPDAYNERLFVNQNEFADKARSYRLAMRSLERDQELLDEEIKRLSNIKKGKQKTIDTLKSYISQAMKLYGAPTKTGNLQFKTPFVNLSYIYTKPVVITDEDKIPDNLIRAKLSATVTKKDWLELMMVIGNIDDDRVQNVYNSLHAVFEPMKTEIKDRLNSNAEDIDYAKIDNEAGYTRFTDAKNIKNEK